MAVALWKRAEFFRGEDDLETASGLAAELKRLESRTGKVAELRPGAARLVDSFSFSMGGEYEKQGNLPKAEELFLQCVDSTDPDIQKGSVAAVVRIVTARSELQKARDSSDLAAEGAALQGILEDLGRKIPAEVLNKGWPSVQDLRDQETVIRNSTGTLVISFPAPSGALAAYKGPATTLDIETAEFRLVPVSEGKPFPSDGRKGKAPRSRNMLIRGVYDIEVYAPGQSRPMGLWLRYTIGEGDHALEVPSRAPEGMAFVGPWPGGGGFFVDLTEVTVGQVKAAAAKDPGLEGLLAQQEGADGRPAWFRDDDQGDADAAGGAQKFAASVGKRIPTLKQWLDAAFGPEGTARPYPWGGEAPDPAKHLVNGVDEAQPVGTRPDGASPYGCLDMVGNVSEWVDINGGLWAIGGYFTGEIKADGHDRLREAAPGFSAYGGLPQADKDRYLKYKAPFEDYYATGLRLVIPVN
jgi:hypothetical protein